MLGCVTMDDDPSAAARARRTMSQHPRYLISRSEPDRSCPNRQKTPVEMESKEGPLGRRGKGMLLPCSNRADKCYSQNYPGGNPPSLKRYQWRSVDTVTLESAGRAVSKDCGDQMMLKTFVEVSSQQCMVCAKNVAFQHRPSASHPFHTAKDLPSL